MVALGIEVEVVEGLSEEFGVVMGEGIDLGSLRAEKEGRREGKGKFGEGRSEMEGKEEEKGKGNGLSRIQLKNEFTNGSPISLPLTKITS